MHLLGAQKHSVKVYLGQIGDMFQSMTIEEGVVLLGLIGGDLSFRNVYDLTMLEADRSGDCRASRCKHQDS